MNIGIRIIFTLWRLCMWICCTRHISCDARSRIILFMHACTQRIEIFLFFFFLVRLTACKLNINATVTFIVTLYMWDVNTQTTLAPLSRKEILRRASFDPPCKYISMYIISVYIYIYVLCLVECLRYVQRIDAVT